MRLGVLAGGGALPIHIARSAAERGELAQIIALKPFANVSDFDGMGATSSEPLGRFGAIVKTLKRAKVTHMTFAGIVDRPDFSKLKPDLMALRNLPGAIRAAKDGDDALMRHMMGLFEEKGFIIVPPQALSQDLLLPEGALGVHGLSAAHRDDALKAIETARAIGRLDIGQGAIIARGVVLAVEAQEGTDAMLSRIAGLSPAVRGTAEARAGVLAKWLKPTQDPRIDLPTLGPDTIRGAAAAGLAGIVAEAGQAFLIQPDLCRQLADEAGLFVVGVPTSS